MAGAFIAAAFNYLLDFCMEKPGRIFGWYRVWLAKRILKRYEPDTVEKLKLQIKTGCRPGMEAAKTKAAQHHARLEAKDQLIKRAEPYAYWAKMFGWCAICFNVWIATGIYFAATDLLHGINWSNAFSILLFNPVTFTTLSSYFLRKMLGQ